MKVSFLLPSRGVAGSTRSTVCVGNELLSRGYEVRIFYRDDTLGLREKLRRFYLDFRYDGNKHDWLLHFNGQHKCYVKLDSLIFEPNEIIVAMCARTALDMWQLPKNISIKTLYCRGAEIENWDNMLRSWMPPTYKIALSSHVAQLIKKEVKQDVVGIVPNGVDTVEFYTSVSEKQRNGIGSIYAWGRTKDPDSILKIIQMIGQKIPHAPRYLFSNGKKPKGLKDVNFTRLPMLKQSRDIYSSCKVWFLASIMEGFGNPILEAMACGCAIVSTNCGGPEDIIEDGVNGFLVDVGNIGGMVHKIELLYKDEKLRQQICKNAAETVHDFSWTNSADKLEECLLSIYNDRRNNHSSKNVTMA